MQLEPAKVAIEQEAVYVSLIEEPIAEPPKGSKLRSCQERRMFKRSKHQLSQSQWWSLSLWLNPNLNP